MRESGENWCTGGKRIDPAAPPLQWRPMSRPAGVTGLLRAWSEGDPTALDALIPLVEAELHRLARSYMARERRDHTLQATALVNEAFLRLTGAEHVQWKDRAHFLGIAARLMRRVLIDHARQHAFKKRGGDMREVTVEDARLAVSPPDVDLLALDRALESLSNVDERKARVVELRYFVGMTIQETADALNVSVDTVKRDWQVAKLFLLRALENGR
jgi:RNA polymerase sigma factor (TIGR02999 family)